MGAFATPIIMAVSTGIGVAGQVVQSRQAAQAREWQRYGIESDRATRAAQINESERRRDLELRRLLASRRAAYGAAGVASAEGSAAGVVENMAAESAREGAFNVGQWQAEDAGQRGRLDLLQHQENVAPWALGLSAGGLVARNLLAYRQLNNFGLSSKGSTGSGGSRSPRALAHSLGLGEP